MIEQYISEMVGHCLKEFAKLSNSISTNVEVLFTMIKRYSQSVGTSQADSYYISIGSERCKVFLSKTLLWTWNHLSDIYFNIVSLLFMNILSPSFIDLKNDLLDVNSKSTLWNDQWIYLNLLNGSVLFGGDNKQYESDSCKIKLISSVAGYKLLQFFRNKNNFQNYWNNDVTAIGSKPDSIKFFDKDNTEVTNFSQWIWCTMDLILTDTMFKNRFDCLIIKQIRIFEMKELYSLFDECQF